MKEAINFAKIDYAMSRKQSRIYLLFVVVAFWLAISSKSPLFVTVYLSFGSVVLATSPFGMDTFQNMAFINLLPATTRKRVNGRYLFSFLYVLCSFVISEIFALISGTDAERNITLIFPLAMLGMALVIIAIQYTLLYWLGVKKSAQYMRLVCMIPAFVMFGLTSGVSEIITDIQVTERMLKISLVATFVMGVVIWLIGKEISICIVDKKKNI